MNENLDKISFYILDDDIGIVNLIQKMLESPNHIIHSNTDSEQALKEIKEIKPNFLLTDQMMHGIDGIELVQKVRADASLKEIKIVMVSSKSYEYDRKEAFEAGVDGFITKPINANSFQRDLMRIYHDKVDLHFWGARGTLPVAGENSVKYGGNTSCVTLEFPKGPIFIFDGGTGLKAFSDHLMHTKRTKIEANFFISHPHWDHINAIPFFAPLYIPGNKIDIYGAPHGEQGIEELLSKQMSGVYFPISIREFSANVRYHDIKEVDLEFDEIAVKTMFLSHPGRCLGYRVNFKNRSICYITDNELFPKDNPNHNSIYREELISFVQGTDILITDSTYTDEEYKSKVGWGHSCLTEVLRFAHEAKVKDLFLFHHDPDQNDEAIEAKLNFVKTALEQLDSQTQAHLAMDGLSKQI